MSRESEKLSVFISLILRHKPYVVGIELDACGYADVDALLRGINASGKYITLEILDGIVASDKKRRYSFNADKTKIRANQGHSVKVNVEMEELEPPMYLYHGTADKSVDSILRLGLLKKNRLHVHLSDNVTTAREVGKRHGKPVILKIDAKRMNEDGIKFYKSSNGVWLVDTVDVKYIEVFSGL